MGWLLPLPPPQLVVTKNGKLSHKDKSISPHFPPSVMSYSRQSSSVFERSSIPGLGGEDGAAKNLNSAG